MQRQDSQLLNNVSLLDESEEATENRAQPSEHLAEPIPPTVEQTDPTKDAIDLSGDGSQVPKELTTTEEPMRNCQNNQIDPVNNHIETRAHSVGELREYFSNLTQSTHLTENVGHIPKFSYLGKPKSTEALTIDTDSKQPTDLAQTSSVGQLCDFYESSKSYKRSASIRRSSSSTNQAMLHGRSENSKSVEFFCRPPKFRTPSPKYHQRLPTPPPLPLPPSPDLNDSRKKMESNRVCNKRLPCYTSNLVTHLRPNSQPIKSEQLPYRSRSLALDQPITSFENSKERMPRYRAYSITQRSLSPEIPKAHEINNYSQIERMRVNTASNEVQTAILSFSNPYRSLKANKGTQSPGRTLVNEAQRAWDAPDVIQLDPTDTDGIYVRSAVVYERIAEKSTPDGPKHFITTYVVAPSPTCETVRATNLWVAQKALQSSHQEYQMQPYRSQTLKHNNLGKPSMEYRSASMRLPRERTARFNQRQRSLSTSSKYRTQQTLPLPTPPPTELHPYILRCSQNSSPIASNVDIKSSVDKCIQCTQRRYEYSPSPTRSWSVKSLSPPPFRTPWLSSLKGSRSHSRSNQNLDREKFNITENYPTRGRSRQIRNTKIQTIEQHCNNRSALSKKDYHHWMRKAESLSRERQAYHEQRGSWSPPHIKSPARYIPNNLEENTESEIRSRVRRRQPLSPVPPYPALDQSTQTANFHLQETRLGITRMIDREISTDFEQLDRISVASGCIDTTPITEDFDAKRDYFEELIRTNQLRTGHFMAHDHSDHPVGKSRNAYNCFSSWDTDLVRVANKDTSDANRHPSASSQTRPTQTDQFNDAHVTDGAYKRLAEKDLMHPQQYSSTLYMTTKHPHHISEWDRQQFDLSRHSWDSGSIQHEYYAKPRKAMPQVAPNPPFHHGQRVRTNGPPPRVELVHSPTEYVTERDWNMYPIRYGATHSPPCRFYNSSKNNSFESIHDPRNPVDKRGRVKQIVSDLNDRRYYENSVS